MRPRGGPGAGPARHGHLPVQRAFARRTPPATGRERRSNAGSRRTRSCRSGRGSCRAGVFPESTLDETRARIEAVVLEMFQLAIDPARRSAHRRRVRPGRPGDVLQRQRLEKCDDRPPELLQAWSQNARVQQIKGKHRTPEVDGKPVPKGKAVQRPRRHLRGPGAQVQRRSRHGGLRRGEPRLGRRVRRLSRPDRGARRIIACSTRRSPRRPSSGPPSATRSRAAARWSSSCTAISWAGRATRSSTSSRSGRRCRAATCDCRSCCASRSASSTARSTRRTGPRWCTTSPGSRSSTRSRPTTRRA